MRKRQIKKSEPFDWGSTALICDDDVRHVKGATGRLPGPDRDVKVVFWRSRKQSRWKGRTTLRAVACYEAFDPPVTNGRVMEMGRLHFNRGDLDDATICHEVIHASCHAERIIGGDPDEERLCYRAQRLFRAIQEFRDLCGLGP